MAIRTEDHSDLKKFGNRLWYVMTGKGYTTPRALATSLYDQQLVSVKSKPGKYTRKEDITYMGIGSTKKWERLESYGPKFCENIVQAISRDILCYAMQTLRTSRIVAHVHAELIIECPPEVSLQAVSDQMGRTPPWAPGLVLRADGDEMAYYQKA